MNCFSQEQLNKISNLVREVEKLSDIERLLLYLQLPCGRTELPEGKYKTNSGNSSSSSSSSSSGGGGNGGHQQSTDIFSKKSDQETTQTYTWILSHLEEDPNVSLPKQEVYDDYRAFCQANKFEPLCVADFGKAMKHALPCIKPRRLGQRGNSRYCYSGLRKKYKIEAPSLPDLMVSEPPPQQQQPPPPPPPQGPSAQPVLRSAVGASATDQYYPNGRSREPTRLAKNQCPNSNLYEYPTQTTTTAAASPPTTNISQQQQQQQTRSGRHDGAVNATANANANATAATFMNLKLEPCSSTQSQCGPGGTNSSPGVLECCNPSANGHVQSPFNTDNNASNSRLPHVVPPNTSDLYHHNIQIDNSGPLAGGHSVVQPPQLIRCEPVGQHYSQPSFIQRSGTPDDDDYRHNYHDLNRPIVGPAIIPFSQSLTAQLAQQSMPNNGFISYNNSSHPLPATVNHLPQQDDHQHQHHQQHLHQHQQAQELRPMSKIVSPDSRGSSHLPIVNQQQQQQHPSVITNSCCRDTNGTSSKIKSGPNASHLGSSEDNQHRRHDIDDELQYEMGSSGNNNNNNNTDDGADRDPIELSIHNPSDPLHINLSLFNHCSGSNLDYCASPFQSPASTPYPIMSNYPTAQDTQDYYPGECISYPDQ